MASCPIYHRRVRSGRCCCWLKPKSSGKKFLSVSHSPAPSPALTHSLYRACSILRDFGLTAELPSSKPGGRRSFSSGQGHKEHLAHFKRVCCALTGSCAQEPSCRQHGRAAVASQSCLPLSLLLACLLGAWGRTPGRETNPNTVRAGLSDSLSPSLSTSLRGVGDVSSLPGRLAHPCVRCLFEVTWAILLLCVLH